MQGPFRALAFVTVAMSAGCTSFNGLSAERVDVRKQAIEQRFGVPVDLSRASALRGNTWRTLSRIEKDLAPFPRAYTTRIATIHVVEDFVARYGPIALGMGAYCEDERPAYYRHVFIKNKNLLEDVYGYASLDVGTHLAHEGWHSVEYWEIMRHAPMFRQILPDRKNLFSDLEIADETVVAESLRNPPADDPRRAYIRLLRGWMFAHFGDVNGDGRVDGADADAVAADRDRFDANKDGRLTYADVRRLTPYRYLRSITPLDPILQLAMTVQLVTTITPRGFASAYGSTYPWEDRAEVMALVHRRGLLHLVRKIHPERGRAARRLERLRRRDPVLARKVDLLLRYLQTCQAASSTPD